MMQQKNNIKKCVAVVCLSFLLVTFSGCSKSAEESRQQESGQTVVDANAKITSDDSTVKYESDKVEYEASLDKDVSLPDGYPADDVPVYPNGRVAMAGKDGAGYAVTIVTDDSIAKIYEYYEKNSKLDSVTMKQNMEQTAMLSGTLDGMDVGILISENAMSEDGKNMITIAIGE